jgi:glycosyltransferase involved in cell wall biosynthesis
MINYKPYVTVIIPCRNEETFIDKCLDSIIVNDYPKDRVEVLVIDGMSQDKTREIIEGYADRYSFIRLLDNPKKITPAALNTGVRNAKGEVLIRMDAHASYKKEYISKCVKFLNEYGADNVGGKWKIVPRDNTFIGKGIVQALSHSFGIGNAYYRFINNKEPLWVDTVPFFCCRKNIFKKVGVFNENLTRGQDQEFNLRLRKAKLKTLLVPEIESYYYARTDFKSFYIHNFKNGIWAILPFKYTTIMPVSWRHLAPLAFVSSIIIFGVLSFFFQPCFWPFFIIIGLYSFCSIYFSTKLSIKKRDLRYLIVMPIIFGSLHISYGLGSLLGVLKAVISKQFWKNRLYK